MQLDALLDSLRQNMAGDPLPPTPSVIWTASTPEFEDGYKRLFNTHAGWCGFHKQQNFNDDYLALLGDDGYVIHYVDDDIQHGRVNLDHAMQTMKDDDELICVSLRLGANTTYCYPLDQPQPLPPSMWVTPDGMLQWRWVGASHDASYPFSLDGHMLRVEDVRQMLYASIFRSPNELEQTLASRAWMRSAMRPKMASYARSCVTGVPANVVNTTHPNRHASLYSPELLNQWYLDGARISWRHMNWGCVDAAHVALNYVFDPIAKAA